jgi:hypothetical protein
MGSPRPDLQIGGGRADSRGGSVGGAMQAEKGRRGGVERDPQFGGGNGGPPRMEGGRGNLEGNAKWRSI